MTQRHWAILAVVGFGLVAYFGRYDVDAHARGVIVHDRWLGHVSLCTSSQDAGSYCQTLFPAARQFPARQISN